MPAAAAASSNSAGSTPSKKIATAPEKKYKCQFCNRAFSRSEHRSRHERSRKFIYFFSVDVGSNDGKVHALVAGSISFLADPLLSPSQTPRSVLSNVRNVEAPSSAAIFCYGTTGPSMPKMVEYLSSAKSRDGRAQSRLRWRARPKHPSSWTRRRWSRWRQAVRVISISKLLQC